MTTIFDTIRGAAGGTTGVAAALTQGVQKSRVLGARPTKSKGSVMITLISWSVPTEQCRIFIFEYSLSELKHTIYNYLPSDIKVCFAPCNYQSKSCFVGMRFSFDRPAPRDIKPTTLSALDSSWPLLELNHSPRRHERTNSQSTVMCQMRCFRQPPTRGSCTIYGLYIFRVLRKFIWTPANYPPQKIMCVHLF